MDIGALSWCFSPCPNDTFAFGPLVLGMVEGAGRIAPSLHDIELLNGIASRGEADVVKVSAAHYPQVAQEYCVLRSGAAMGVGVGPLVVGRTGIGTRIDADSLVAIPGVHTTANALLTRLFPKVVKKREYLFSDIERAVAAGEVDAGLLIHEGRFTYQQHGLQKLYDLGDLWHSRLGVPLPLGLILVRRSLPKESQQHVQSAIAESVAIAHRHPERVMPYVATHAQAMSPEVQQKHIALYVNRFTENMGDDGQRALHELWQGVPGAGQMDEKDCFC